MNPSGIRRTARLFGPACALALLAACSPNTGVRFHDTWADDAAFSSDGQRFHVIDYKRSIVVDTASHEVVCEVPKGKREQAQISPDGRIVRWPKTPLQEGGEVDCTLSTDIDAPTPMAEFRTDKPSIYNTKPFAVWRVGTDEPLLVLKPDGYVLQSAISTDGTRLAIQISKRLEPHIAIYDLTDGSLLWSLPLNPPTVRHPEEIAFTGDGQQLLIRYSSTLLVLDAESSQPLRFLEPGPTPRPFPKTTSMAVHPTEHLVAVGHRNGRVQVFDTDRGVLLHEHSRQQALLGRARWVSWSLTRLVRPLRFLIGWHGMRREAIAEVAISDDKQWLHAATSDGLYQWRLDPDAGQVEAPLP